MPVLLLGGRGKTSIRIASLLSEANVPFALASRTASLSCSYDQVYFDWYDESSWSSMFSKLNKAKGGSENSTTAVYIVPPSSDLGSLAERVIKFVRLAQEHGAKRFVLLSASLFERGSGPIGAIHEYLASSAESPDSDQKRKKEIGGAIEYAVLRPSWFMGKSFNLSFTSSLKEKNAIYTAAGAGKLPFVSADDIARVGFYALTDAKPHNTDHLILGPELLSYDDTANILTSVLGRQINHVPITEQELATHLTNNTSWSEEFCDIVATLDARVERGEDSRLNSVVEHITGRAPIRFEDFVKREKWRWM
ncbi:agroclavine dehydrogenase [Aspergillus nidulans var. acristatus]